MSTLKFTNPQHWQHIDDHLAAAASERFAFAFTTPLTTPPATPGATPLVTSSTPATSGPVLEVVDIVLVADEDVEHDHTGWYITEHALDRIHNQAVRTGTGLAEFHNHRKGPPRFSPTDERGLVPTASYVLDLLPGRPYAALVWAGGVVHGEWFATAAAATNTQPDTTGPDTTETDTTGLTRGTFDTVVVHGPHLRVINTTVSADTTHSDTTHSDTTGDATGATAGRFTRQTPVLSTAGQATVAALRVAVVGAGGTGSQLLLQLAYLGFRHFVVLDGDTVETSNLNRLVTADAADLGIAKTTVARRRLRSIDAAITVVEYPAITVSGEHPELRDVDLIIGCVDHDGPRQRLNQIAVDTRTPYLDIATGIDIPNTPTNTDAGQGANGGAITPPIVAGGRACLILPGGPCLQCLDELDPAEIARWAKPANQQRLDRLHGYGTGVANPAVVHLNALTVSAAVTELVTWISGIRPPAGWLDIDLIGSRARPGTVVATRATQPRDATCLACGSRPAATG